MDILNQKKQAFAEILNQYNITPLKVEQSETDYGLAFYFESKGTPDPFEIQKAMTPVFDYAKSVSVFIDKTNDFVVDTVPKNVEETIEPLKPSGAEKTDNALDDRLKKVQSENIEIIKNNRDRHNQKKSAPMSDGPMFYGKRFSTDIEPMSNIDFSDTFSSDSGRHCYLGRVFGTDTRELRNGKQLLTFSVTDETGSVSCKMFLGKEAEQVIDRIKNDNWVQIEGELTYDEFVHERVLMPKVIATTDRPKRSDDAPVKRVELHMHTQYSAMDAVSKVKKIVRQAEDFGHDVISVTDHGVAQAYPEVLKLTKGKDIKVLYGVEGYMVNDNVKIIIGNHDESFDGEFIFFDLETTGFVPGKEKIIEIAAARIKNGQIADTFQTFVNPHRAIPSKITNLTGINDEMVASGMEEEEAVRKFLDYVGGDIVVAHNASFDMSFMSRAMSDHGIENELTYIDTLAMARALLPNIARHNLKKLASYFKIDMGHHHRAIDDAICSAKIFVKLLSIAEKHGVCRAADLNKLINLDQVIKTEKPYHVIIFAKNQKGLRSLYEIISVSHTQYFYKKPRIPKSLLAKSRENLLIGSACNAGELYQAVKDNAAEDKLVQVASFYDYLEVQPLGNNDFMVRNGEFTKEELIGHNKTIIALGEKLGKLVVATGDVHFVDPNDAIYRSIIQAGQGYHDSDHQAPLYYRSTEDMLNEFDYLDEETAYDIVVSNTRKIADMIDDVLPIPNGTFPPVIEGSDDDIRKMVYDKAKSIYGETLPEIVAERIDKELTSIIGNGYSVLYLIAQKLVHHSLEDGYLVGSRGSVGSSLVAMLCGITEVNSLPPHYICPNCKHVEFFDSTKVGVGPDLPDANCPDCGTKLIKDGFDIPFETFLGFKGDKEPDIDLNFSGDNQGEAHRYTEVIFGKGKTFRAGTIATLADKTAFGYVKNYLEERGIVAGRAEMDRLIEGCSGIKRTTGQHPGGVMVVPRDKEIYEFTPIQYPADDPDCGTVTTHFDYHSIEGRLLKLDILGHDDPTMLRMLKDLTGIDPTSIALDDEKILSLFHDTSALNLIDNDFDLLLGTCGVPEFGTSFVREMVKDAKPSTFADLIRISGLSHGTDVWIGNAQSLIESNTATIKEVICTRDDIMIGLISMGLPSEDAFWIMEHVRKGKGLTDAEETQMRDYHVPEWYIDSCKKIKYMFPKAHAVAYVMMAFRIAYYKVYEPLAYYAAYFSIRAKEFDLATMTDGKNAIKQKMANIKAQGKQASNKEQNLIVSLEIALEMYCRGFRFGKVDVYKSHYKYFRIEDDSLIPPLSAIDGMGEIAAKSIYEEAQKEPFMSMEDLQNRANVNKTNLEKMKAIGCLSGMPESNQISFFGMF